MNKILILILAALVPAAGIQAQSTGNPAENAALESGFLRVGDFSNTLRNNVGAASFLFPSGGKLVTGLHSSVSDEEFLGGLKPVNSLYSQIDYNLFSYGWKGTARGYHTVEVGLRTNYGVSVPKEVFQILKTGTSQSPYDLSSFRAFGNLFAELVYGYALPLTDALSLGGRVKLLAGLNSVDITARQFALATSEDKYTLDIDADIDLTNRNKKVGVDDEGFLDYTSFSGKGKLGIPSGAGLALDFGVVWKAFSGFSLSASVSDLGGILWYYGNAGLSSGTYTFEGLENLSTEEMEQDKLASKMKEAGEELLRVIRPKSLDGRFRLKGLPLNANLNAAYALPFWERLSVDASCLYTGYRFCAPYWEARGGLSLDYPGLCSLAVNAGGGAEGFVYGVAGSVDFLAFRLYARYENGAGGVIPYEDIPLKANHKLFRIGLMYLIK